MRAEEDSVDGNVVEKPAKAMRKQYLDRPITTRATNEKCVGNEHHRLECNGDGTG